MICQKHRKMYQRVVGISTPVRALLAVLTVATVFTSISTFVFISYVSDIYREQLPAKENLRVPLFDGNETFPFINGFVRDEFGAVVEVFEGTAVANGTHLDPILTYGPSSLAQGAQLTPDSPSLFLNISGGTAFIGLLPRGVEGNYSCMNAELASDGTVVQASSGLPIQSGDVLYANSTVGQTLFDLISDVETAPLVTFGPSNLDGAKPVVAVGPSFFFNTSGPTIEMGLLDRGTAGFFLRPSIYSESDGTILQIMESPPLTATDIAFSNTTVDAALSSNFLTTIFSPHVPNSRPLVPDFNDFIYAITPTAANVELRPRPMMNAVCTHPIQQTWDAKGFTDSCTSGPVPGTPGGSATLDGSGKLDPAQIPDVLLGLPLIGLWNAGNNTPALSNASCPAEDRFYYLVSDAGNVTLGHHAVWLEGDLAVCINGTWDRISRPLPPEVTFNGRSSPILPQIGDYTASMITSGNFTLDIFLNYGFIFYTASPGMPNGLILSPVANETTVAGATVGLAHKSNFPALSNVFSGAIIYADVDNSGRLNELQVGPVVFSVAGTVNQISATPGPNVTLSLEQDIDVNADVEFNSLTVDFMVLNGKTVQSLGTGVATIPNSGPAADFVMTEGAQVVNGQKDFSSTLRVLSGQGLTLNNVLNTFSQQILPATGLAANTLFRLPPTNGAPTSILERDGSDGTQWSTTYLRTATGTANRVIITGTAQNPIFSTPQDLHTAATVQFASAQLTTLVLNGKTVQSIGTGTVTIPDVGTSSFVMNAGAQIVGGTKGFSATAEFLGGSGIRLFNGANTFSTFIRANSALAANTNFFTPLTSGNLGEVLTALGGGDTEWRQLFNKDIQNPVLITSTTTTSTTFATLNSMTVTTTNTATSNYKFWFVARGRTSVANIPIEVRLRLNGSPVTNQIATYSQFDNEDSSLSLLGLIPSVPAGSSLVIQWRVTSAAGGPTATVTYRSFLVEQV
jgi:hypothetical protein